MYIVLDEIYDALKHLGYDPSWAGSEMGMSFNFNMELAVCHVDYKSRVVMFMVPCVCKVEDRDFEDIIRKVNSRNHVGRLVNVDGSAVSAVSSFYVVDDEAVNSQTCFAVEDLNRLVAEFFEFLL